MNWIQTYDGQDFYPENPDTNKILERTIAVVLSRLARFGGHTKGSYSVAEHSIHVYRLVKTPELKLPALLHDAHEVYTGFGDVCSPSKQFAPKLKELEYKIDGVIAEKFGFDHRLFYAKEIKHADLVMLATEKKFLMKPETVPWIDMPDPLPVMPILNGNQTLVGEFLFILNYLVLRMVKV